MSDDMEIIRGSGNVFRDLGHPEADREQLLLPCFSLSVALFANSY